MAIALDDADFYEVNTAARTTGPFTVSAWFRAPDVTDEHVNFALADASATNNYFFMMPRGNVAGDPLRWAVRSGAAEVEFDTSNGYTANVWQHSAAREISTTSRNVILNGDIGNMGTDTTDVTPSGIDTTSIGRVGDASPAGNNGNHLADVAIWDVDLSDNEIVALSKGFTPDLIRPSSLINYWPAVKSGTTLPDIVGSLTLTQGGTVVDTDHPSLIRSSVQLIILPIAAGGGGLSIPVAMHSYRQRRANP